MGIKRGLSLLHHQTQRCESFCKKSVPMFPVSSETVHLVWVTLLREVCTYPPSDLSLWWEEWWLSNQSCRQVDTPVLSSRDMSLSPSVRKELLLFGTRTKLHNRGHADLQTLRQLAVLTLLNFHFCLPLIPPWASREERDVCLQHAEMPGQEGCYTEIVSLWLC